MKLLRHKEHRGSRGFIRVLAAMMFCLALSIGTVCYADEVAATVTVASAKSRASADPRSQQLGSAKQGGTVSIIGQTTGTDGKTWYQVFVDANTKGFIRADLVNVTGTGTIGSVSSDASASASTATTTTTDTQVSSTDKKSGTVQTNNVRIRKGASTTADVVATANRGMVVTVTGEAAGDDGKTWYQISFTYNSKEITGFIRSDLVTFDTLPADTAQTTINGTSETPEEPATEATTEEVTESATEEEPQEQESSSYSNDTQNMILMNVEDVPYIMPEFNPIILKWEDQDINAYKNGDFYLFYAQKQNGEEGWYVFDSVNNVYERYVYSTAGATVPETSAMSGNMLPVIILAVIIVILLIAIILMFMKLREYTGEYEEYEDDEEDDEYGDEEEAEDEEEELAEESARRPMQQPRRQPAQQPRPQQPVRNQESREEGQPVRRPQQPVRRPQGEEQRTQQQPPRRQEGQQPARRPQQQGQPVRHQEGEQPVRRQAQQAESARPAGRQPQGNPNRRPAQPRPENQPKRNVQQGRKAKNFLDSEDDDMEFIDI